MESVDDGIVKSLYTAAVDRDLDNMESIVRKSNVDVNYIFTEPYVQSIHQGGTILHIVAEKGKLDVVQGVVALGADVCFQNKSGDTPIHIACKHGNKKAVQCFLSNNHLCKDMQNNQGMTPIMRAMFRYETAFKSRYLTIIQWLIHYDCDVNLASSDSKVTPLHMAAKIWDPQLTSLLLKAGGDVNALDKTNMNPLLNALSSKRLNPEIVKLLVNNGANLNFKNPNGKAPLHIATSKSDDLCVQYMLEAGAEPDIQTYTGSTPLWIAVIENNLKIACLLIKYGADVNYIPIGSREYMLSLAVQNEYIEMTEVLLEKCNLQTIMENTEADNILSKAIRTGNLKIIKMLLYRNFPLEEFDKIFTGVSVLAFGIKFLDILKLLIVFGLKIDVSEHIMALWEIPEEFLATDGTDAVMEPLRQYVYCVPSLKNLCCLELHVRSIFGIQIGHKQLKKLYMDTASIVWNGNAVSGMDAVLKFFESIPTSEHKMESLDCQPITDSVSGGQFTIVVKVYGTVKYLKRKPKTFHQNFMLTSQNNVWKIVSDSFRYQE
ncbi:hypothetical protein FSP39_014616 [Pinctada imbricata]|uniref:NTF2 domain-containing protein n=1 Tax=Pinctada imbricata TaxID=66713 RepID=A0AA88YIK1_PINIB|nr:hypothetical protein FSP39_014616 [Pinctada imbricata]